MRLLLAWSCLVAALCAVPLASWAQLGQSDCSLARSEIDRDACYRANRENAQRNSTSRQRVEEATRRATPSPQEAERAEYWRKRTEEENTRRYEQDRAYKQSEAYKIQQALEKKAVMDRVWERRQLFAAVPALHRFNPPLRATVRSSNGYSAMGGDRVVQQWVRQLFPDTAEHIIEHASTDFLEQDRYKKCWTRDGTPGTVLALMPVGQDSRRAALFRYECQDTDLYVFESLSTDETASEALRIERQDYVALLTTAGVPAAQHFPPAPELTALQKLERRCHDDNDTAACARAAKAYAAGDGTGRNPNLAAQLLLQACRPPQPQGCGALAGALYMGDGLERSMKRARETAQGPCQDSRDPAACAVMGSLYLHGYQVDRDYTQALAHLQTACTGGDGLGCLGLGQMYEEGRGVVRDRGKARQAYDSGCKARISDACARLKGMQGMSGGRWVLPALALLFALALYAASPLATAAERTLPDLQQACDGGDAEACNAAGVRHFMGEGTQKSVERALALYAQACDGGSAFACQNMALLYDNGKDVPKDVAKASALYRRACDGAHPAGCLNWGWALEHGEGVAKDVHQARHHYVLACELGHGLGCANAGLLNRQLQGGDGQTAWQLGVAKHGSQKLLWDHGCRLGHARSCELARSYEPPQQQPGVWTPSGTSEKLAGCLQDSARDCYEVASAVSGDNYIERLDISRPKDLPTKVRDFQMARLFLLRACDLGHADACTDLGVQYYNGTQVFKALSLAMDRFIEGCDLGNGMGCDNVGVMFRGGVQVNKSPDSAGNYFHKACELGTPKGCADLPSVWKPEANPWPPTAPSTQALQKACKAGQADGCLGLGQAYATGQGAPRSAFLAAGYHAKACDAGSAAACHALGRQFEAGDGVRRSRVRALDFMEMACNAGTEAACADFRRLKAAAG